MFRGPHTIQNNDPMQVAAFYTGDECGNIRYFENHPARAFSLLRNSRSHSDRGLEDG